MYKLKNSTLITKKFILFYFSRDLRVISDEEFSSVDPLRTLPIDDEESFVRFFDEEGTVLIKGHLYDLKFGVGENQALTCKVTFAVNMHRGPTEHDVVVHVPVGNNLFVYYYLPPSMTTLVKHRCAQPRKCSFLPKTLMSTNRSLNNLVLDCI